MSLDPIKDDAKPDALKHRFELIGWAIFVLSAICFIVSSVGNPWAMAGSLLFLFACILFLIPYFARRR